MITQKRKQYEKFAACDECYAISNAKPEVKKKATAIIGGNKENSVAKWMEANALSISFCDKI